MKQLTRDLEFFRNKYKNALGYDNGTGCYLADHGDETIDIRSSNMDVWNGVISAETAADYLEYRSATDNFLLGMETTKREIGRIWEDVEVVRDTDNNEFVRKDLLKVANWEADTLEKGRRAAVQE
jgi:hypothetical protein